MVAVFKTSGNIDRVKMAVNLCIDILIDKTDVTTTIILKKIGVEGKIART